MPIVTFNYIKKELTDLEKSIVRDKEESAMLKLKLNEAKYTQQVSAKLNLVLRSQKTLTLPEALSKYTANVLRKKFIEILKIIDYINSNLCIYVIDKITVCTFLRITLETYQFMLTDVSVDSQTAEMMKEIENYLIQQAQQSTELKLRQDKSVERRMGMSGDYGGNDLKFGKNATQKVIDAETNRADLKKKLATSYNFIEAGDENNAK